MQVLVARRYPKSCASGGIHYQAAKSTNQEPQQARLVL